METFLQQTFLENSTKQWLWFAGILLAVFVFKRYISHLIGAVIYRVFRKMTEDNKVKYFNLVLMPPLQWLVMLTALGFAFRLLHYPTDWHFNLLGIDDQLFLERCFVLIITVNVIWMLLRIVDFISYVMELRAEKTDTKLDDQLVPFLRDMLKVIVYLIAFIFILHTVFKLNVTSLLAGLGIGGLAFALAAKESLENLFGSFTIFLDRPFTVGDLVKMGDVTGTVEKVGFRSTRLRTPDKTFVTVPNRRIIDSTLNNMSLRTYRRVNFSLTLSYETGTEKLHAIRDELNALLKEQPGFDQDNFVRFTEIATNGFVLTVEYFIPKSEWLDYLKKKEEMNFSILAVVEKHGGKFALPAQQVIVKNELAG